MQVTESEIIKDGEKDLIDSIKDGLDLDAIEELLREQIKIKQVECKTGDIVVHNDEVAFKLDFEIKVKLPVIVDRDGNFLPMKPEFDEDQDNEKE